MSDAHATNETKKGVRGPNKPKPPMDPVDLARHVDSQTKGWDAEAWAKYNRVLEALRDPP